MDGEVGAFGEERVPVAAGSAEMFGDVGGDAMASKRRELEPEGLDPVEPPQERGRCNALARSTLCTTGASSAVP